MIITLPLFSVRSPFTFTSRSGESGGTYNTWLLTIYSTSGSSYWEFSSFSSDSSSSTSITNYNDCPSITFDSASFSSSDSWSRFLDSKKKLHFEERPSIFSSESNLFIRSFGLLYDFFNLPVFFTMKNIYFLKGISTYRL